MPLAAAKESGFCRFRISSPGKENEQPEWSWFELTDGEMSEQMTIQNMNPTTVV
jgi:hypothetical protein